MDLFWLKLIHTMIAAINASAVFYILYCGVRDRRGPLLNGALAILAAELLSLAACGGNCPLQLYARHLRGTQEYVHDIFLPDWLALNLVTIFTPLTLAGLILTVRNWRRRRNEDNR